MLLHMGSFEDKWNLSETEGFMSCGISNILELCSVLEKI